ncbi:contactin-5-like isoform X2 [Mobula hypostoma]|uniref:contactin-5-like isoform X2 n=1 Tax=Mobula hypostoma TaxID=723540 RepID=UPI002FC39617
MATSWKLLLLMSVTSILTDDLEERGPAFVHEPQELTIAAGEEAKRVSLRCQARGSPRPRYRWFHNGSLLQTEGSPRYGLDGGSLVIHAPSMLLDSGTFQCLASNSVGSVLSREAGLHFAYLSNFSDHQRGPVSVREGQGVVLMCSAPSHTTEVVYSWVYGALPRSVEEDSRRFVSQVTGNLYIAKATPADVGRYICQLKDGQSGRRVLSPPTSLTLRKDGVMGEYEPKMEVHFPSVVQVLQGTTAALECFALGNPVPTISWRRTSGDLPSRARLRKSRAVLEILNVEAGDTGTYECRAENSRGESIVRGVLLVHSRPQWTRPLNDTTLDSGQDLRWECRASGRPQPGYRWLKNGENLLSQNRAVVRNGLLTIARVNRSDAGMYQCVAENRHGKLYSNAELRILASAPSFELHPLPREIVVCVGQELVIECKPQSSPKAALSWRKGTRPLANARVKVSAGGALRITAVTHADSGMYTCRAENVFGSSLSTTTVHVKEATEVELIPERIEVTVAESVVLTCRVTHDPSLQPQVHWALDGHPIDFLTEGSHFESIQAQLSSADLMIRDVQLQHAGSYSCRAETLADSASDTSKLLVRGPPGAPGIVIVEEVSASSATLSWGKAQDNHSPITHYSVQARTPFSLGWQTLRTVPETITGELESAMATALHPWVDYEFRVVATNVIGTGDPSAPSRVVRTQEAVPSVAPANVSGGGGRRGELVITWEPVSEEFQHGRGFGYIVAFRPNGTRAWRETTVAATCSCRYVHRDDSLQPLTLFEVKVGVYNNKGDGPFSPSTLIYSAEAEPQTAPSNVTAISLSASEVLVSWESLPGGSRPSLGYQVSVWMESTSEHWVRTLTTSGNMSSLLVGGLQGHTRYRITVRAFNSAGPGPSSDPSLVTTKKSPPSQAPHNLQWHQEGSSVSLGWEPVQNHANESKVAGYKVLYQREGQAQSEVMETRETEAVVPLGPDGVYLIRVQSVSEGGDGASSPQIRVILSKGDAALSCAPPPASHTSVTLILALVLPSASW